MKLIRLLQFILVLILLPEMACTPANSSPVLIDTKVCGLSLVAPPNPFSEDPIPPIQHVGANWIAVCPFAFTREGTNWVRYNSQWQWWGEKPEGVKKSIELAHAANIKVMLKPHVYFPGSWPGALEFDKESDWESWENDFTNYIMDFAAIAQEMDVELFSIGVEFKKSVVVREAFWRGLIQKVKTVYNGPLTYSANWDEFQSVPFWDALDYIGIDAYFPLLDHKTPDVKALTKSWRPHLEKIRTVYKKTNKPVLFTEFGYLSVDGCAYNTWELEAQIHSLELNEQAQANAFDALFTVFWNEPWWHGGFVWKWFPNMEGHEGYPAKDYTPQGKTCESILREWYSNNR
ncbi:MAG: hypothetical protein KDC34_03615 [Saprospiraceae bacterium]|nr:hypothetical protein [Saprospiraceae bacterium]